MLLTGGIGVLIYHGMVPVPTNPASVLTHIHIQAGDTRQQVIDGSSLPPRENTGGPRGGSGYPISVLEQILGC